MTSKQISRGPFSKAESSVGSIHVVISTSCGLCHLSSSVKGNSFEGPRLITSKLAFNSHSRATQHHGGQRASSALGRCSWSRRAFDSYRRPRIWCVLPSHAETRQHRKRKNKNKITISFAMNLNKRPKMLRVNGVTMIKTFLDRALRITCSAGTYTVRARKDGTSSR